jgi:hypothetical protein
MFCKAFIYVPPSVADPDPSFLMKTQDLNKSSNRLTFRTFWLVICKSMRFRIQLITLIQFRILPSNLMRIHEDPDSDSQHWFHLAIVLQFLLPARWMPRTQYTTTYKCRKPHKIGLRICGMLRKLIGKPHAGEKSSLYSPPHHPPPPPKHGREILSKNFLKVDGNEK